MLNRSAVSRRDRQVNWVLNGIAVFSRDRQVHCVLRRNAGNSRDGHLNCVMRRNGLERCRILSAVFRRQTSKLDAEQKC